MKRFLFLLIIPLCTISDPSYAQSTKSPSGKGHIVAGCLINALGVGLIVHSFNVRKGPPGYAMPPDEERSRQEKSAGIGILGGICLVVGTLNIAKGVKMNNKRRWEVALVGTGLRFKYKI